MEDAERMKSRLREDKSIKLKQTEEIDVILLSLNEINLGEIKEVNNYAANLFGYICKEDRIFTSALTISCKKSLPIIIMHTYKGFLETAINKSIPMIVCC
jgi:hypothetical protein